MHHYFLNANYFIDTDCFDGSHYIFLYLYITYNILTDYIQYDIEVFFFLRTDYFNLRAINKFCKELSM